MPEPLCSDELGPDLSGSGDPEIRISGDLTSAGVVCVCNDGLIFIGVCSVDPGGIGARSKTQWFGGTVRPEYLTKATSAERTIFATFSFALTIRGT